MSKETHEWLSENVLVGWTSKRGEAWHYQEGDDNHYPEAIPMDDVKSRLFNWHPVLSPIYVEDGEGFSPVPDRIALSHSESKHVLGIFHEGYPETTYQDRLIDPLIQFLDDPDLSVGSAGLLKLGAVAWIQIDVPDNVVTPEGIEFRPHILAASSLDGSLSNTYKRVVTNIVCDNTMSMALHEDGQEYKVKNTRNSALRIAEARQALEIIYSAADDFSAQVAALCEQTVTDAQWATFVEELAPIGSEDKPAAVTKAENKREILTQLYKGDARCEPWKGTAYGVVQTMNTYGQHVARVNKGTQRVEKNMLSVLKGQVDESDKMTLNTLNKVLQAA